MESLKSLLKLGAVVALIVLLIAAAFILGYETGNRTGAVIELDSTEEQESTSVIQNTLSPEPASSEVETIHSTSTPQTAQEEEMDPTESAPTDQLEATPESTLTEDEAVKILREVWDLVDSEFYGELPTPEDRIYGAIRGMLSTLDDNYTSFLEPSIAQIERTDASGQFEGIGALVTMNEDGILEIVRPFEGSPAEEAGLLPGDAVLEVDNQSIVGYGIYEAIALIRGPENSEVILTIQRDMGSDPFEVSVTRRRIDIPVVESRMLEDNIGYVSLFEFGGQATSQLEEAIAQLLDQGAEALIFDLRNNPGGFLDQSVRVADLFLKEGTILIERVSNGQQREFTSTDEGLAQDIPMVALVNSGSASASEIVAGALQDRGRAILIGETTFGKGSVQLPHTLSDGSELRVTIARWFTPNDRVIHEEGLTPDIQVSTLFEELAQAQQELDSLTEELAQGRLSKEEFDRQVEDYQNRVQELQDLIQQGHDPQLERAVEYLQSGN